MAARGDLASDDVSGDAVAGRLLSVNVGLPRDVEWEGRTVRTAIWKEPVDGPRMARRINIDGDDQADRAGHGGEHRAVFVYQIESYDHWRRELGRDDFVPGQFGENLTVEGLPDDEVCVGDRYRIGGAVFEVTQPRVTCFRVGIRMREPQMPSLLVAQHRPGFYLRVLEEGLIEAGDAIIRLATGAERISIADVDALLYLPNRSRDTLERALRIPALSEGWKESFRALLRQGEGASAAAPVAWEGFQPLTVAAVVRESATIVSLVLRAGGAGTFASAVAGQYLTLRLRPAGEDQPALVRSYSLSSITPGGDVRISVKVEPDGAASAYLNDHVRPGDSIDAAAPRGGFVLRDGERPIVLLSAGVGATPVLAMLQALARAADSREVWWVHGARDGAEHAFGEEVRGLLASLPHGHRVVAYSRPGPADAIGAGFDVAGRLTVAAMQDAGVPADADYYLCGPDGFMRELSAGLVAHGVAPERIASETFGAITAFTPGIAETRRPPHQPPGKAGPGPGITFSRSNLTVAWDPSYVSLLELAEACDVPASFSCRSGVCHTCEAGLLGGDVAYSPQPLEPPAAGRVLVCCAQPDGDLIVEL